MDGDSAAELIRQTEAARGYLNPGHRSLANEDPEFLQAYNDLVGRALKHGAREADQDDLPAKYRELVVCALLAFRGEPESAIAGHLRRAMRLGATRGEVVGAFEAAMVPGGAPTLLAGMRVLAGIDNPQG
ncbi:MAG: carboxymuconolactone decarboxylase family protein [Candidatus Dormiibacterota bacterium]